VISDSGLTPFLFLVEALTVWGGFGLSCAVALGVGVWAGVIFDTELGVSASFGSSLDNAVGAGVAVNVGTYHSSC